MGQDGGILSLWSFKSQVLSKLLVFFVEVNLFKMV